MKALRKMIIPALVIAGGLLIGCGSKKSGNSAATPNADTVVTNQECNSNQIYSCDHGKCIKRCAQAGYGWDSASKTCVYVEQSCQIPNGFSGLNRWQGQISVTDRRTYEQFLEDYYICNFYSGGGGFGWDFGSFDCGSWMNYAFIHMDMVSKKLPSTGRAIIFGASSWGGSNQVNIPGEFVVINNDTGFELRTTGAVYAYRGVIRVVVDQGKPSDQYFTVTLYYDYYDFNKQSWRGGQFGAAQVSKY